MAIVANRLIWDGTAEEDIAFGEALHVPLWGNKFKGNLTETLQWFQGILNVIKSAWNALVSALKSGFLNLIFRGLKQKNLFKYNKT